MTDSNDPLEELFVDDPKALDRKKLASLLKGLVFFDRENGEMSFTDTFSKLPNLDKVELAFIADKVRFLMLPTFKSEGLVQKELVSLGIMPIGSVKSSLKTLFDTKRVIRNKTGQYFVPNWRLAEIFYRHEKEKKI